MMSNTSATEIVTMTMVPTSILRVLEDHTLDDVGDVLAAIGRVLEVLVDLFPLDDRDRILLFLEQARDRAAQDRIGLVLEAVDVDAQLERRLRLLERAQPANRLLDLHRR